MAPNKRKKKPASNPARGFATTSLPSRAKVAETDSNDEISTNIEDKTKNGPAERGVNANDSHAVNVVEESQIADMTPEQFEEHLRESELQTLLDISAVKVKANAKRQVTRLETERRLLRKQGLVLHTDAWLPESQVDDILALYEGPSASQMANVSKVDDADLLLKLWTLFLVLQALQLPQPAGTLEKTLLDARIGRSSVEKDALWGFEECLQHLALTSSEALASYDAVSGQNVEQADIAAVRLEDLEVKDVSKRSSLQETQLHSATAIGDDVSVLLPSGSTTNTPAQSADEDANSEESDMDDPESLLPRYIKAMSALTRLYPQQPRSKDKKKAKPQPEESTNAKILRLRQKIESIQRDPLFDQYEASLAWNERHIELQQALQLERRRGEPINDIGEQSQPSETSPPRAEERSVDEGVDYDDGILGGIFGMDHDDASSGPEIDHQAEVNVFLKDFGKFGGVHPRRVLEDYCKMTDPKYQLKLDKLSQSSWSIRYRLTLLWSKPRNGEVSLSAMPKTCLLRNIRLTYFSIHARPLNAICHAV